MKKSCPFNNIKSLKLSKKIYFFILFSLFLVNLQGESPLRSVDLSKQKPSWQAVIGGEAVAPAVETSYGFAVVSDGRMVSTCTSRGNVMWQKGVKGRPSNWFSAWGDFLYLVTNKSILNLVNPSGYTVWSRDCGFEVTAAPVTGWDGRIFVQGNENLSCYGYNGVLKWNISVSSLNSLPLCQFSDGSLIVFLAKTKDSKTTGLHISPFGKIIEEITFAGQIITAAQCENGVLMTFSDGSFGLCTVENKAAVSKWVQHDSRASGGIPCIISSQDKSALLYNIDHQLKVLIIENKTGNLLNNFNAGQINATSLKHFRATDGGFFVSDYSRAIEFTEDGTINWEASLPSSNLWKYMIYTSNNQILICMNDWVLNAFVMSQTINSKTEKKVSAKKYITPSKLIQKYDGVIYSTPSLAHFQEINSILTRDNYGEQEEQICSELKEQTENYLSELKSHTGISHNNHTYYSTNPLFTQTILDSISKTGTNLFVSDIAELLTLEDDPLLLNSLIVTAGNNGFDQNGKILHAFEHVTVKKISKKDFNSAKLLCDSTYEIVKFMGRPALYKQGKAILANFMNPQYDKPIRDYARATLTKIVELEM